MSARVTLALDSEALTSRLASRRRAPRLRLSCQALRIWHGSADRIAQDRAGKRVPGVPPFQRKAREMGMAVSRGRSSTYTAR